MKNRSWIIIFAAVIALCVLSWCVIRADTGSHVACVYKDGVLIRQIDIDDVTEPYEFTVTGASVTNTIRVEKGSIYVSESTCPDKICVEHGELKGGDPIVCLPNRLVIRWLGKTEVSAVVG